MPIYPYNQRTALILDLKERYDHNMQEHFKNNEALSLEAFRDMDYTAIEKYQLPIELMMENAGLQLARIVTRNAREDSIICIGAGNGNNGGGGLVAARRLSGWGYQVYLDLPVEITKPLPKKQLQRALLFGAKQAVPDHTDIWVDAYLGFSQRLPLSREFTKAVQRANASGAKLIALDIPTGISSNTYQPRFLADQVLTLAAPKKILNVLPKSTEIFVADIGIPREMYEHYKIPSPDFSKHQIL
ncbi:NAD(P)H-hydrate epimerase [Poritiphilus flavus]|uniref:NAD(P)H-hydrate epimerase n=1 Tax=Poritiphilus flavus TaxID=2697053 RepID=A0A6L9EHS3_9FLAO|nr:NAD(P)H-hydrate epimerase [Poritiphilus flavus]NAS14048.1 NAD(P)H-hydrate epimerase [Poritiphilus flavus]